MFQRKFKILLGFIVAGCSVLSLHAQMAQDPLLSRTAAVEPNIVFMFDDSASMPGTAIYQYGGSAGVYGMDGPGGGVSTSPITSGYEGRSPDVNLIYYDPRVTYSRRINADGTFMTAGSISGISSFNVYFYKPGSSNIYSVASVTTNTKGSGYPASGVTAAFNAAPSGGTTATATVTTVASSNVSSVSVNTKGSGYPSSGVTATFSAPPAGGVTATGTVTMGTATQVSGVSVNNGGRGYPTNVITASFTPAPGAGGVAATATVATTAKLYVSSVNVTARGTGYPATGKTVTFTAAPAGGVTATGTVNTATFYTMASTTKGSGGSGYTSTPTVAFAAPPAGGVTATGTATVTYTYGVASATQNARGSGYTSVPTVAFAAPPAGGTTATGTATVSSGRVTAITINSAGSGYTAAPAITITGGTGSGASYTAVLSAAGVGSVSAVAISNAGSGYTSAPAIIFSGGGGTGANFTANLSAGSAGIQSISITNPGSGYTTAPTATLGGTAGGSGATLAVVTGTDYVISGISLTNGGAGYAGAPSVQLSVAPAGPNAATATFTVSTSNTNVISGVTITNPGSGYTSTPTVSFTASSGSGASGTVVTGTTYGISSITVGSSGSGYLATPVLTINNAGTGSGATFTVNPTTTVVAGVNQKWNGTGTPTTSASYFTPSYTPDAGSPLATGASVIAYPNTAISTTATYPKFRNRTDCVSSTTSCSWAEERQNYANWNTYHSNRLELAKTGVGLAFQPLNPTFRLGWGTINTLAASTPKLDKGVRLYNATTQSEFLTWLYARTGTVAGTPNRTALNNVGKYYQRADNGGPWAPSPTGDTAVTSAAAEDTTHATCRRSYALLMTDGYYNDSFTLADVDTSTATKITQPSTYQYTPIGPYSDTASGTAIANTFADVAMKYWVTDLRPNIKNNVKSVTGDEAYWQHMNFYAIGLGLVGTLDATNPQVLQSLTGSSSSTPPRSLNWPTPASNDPKAIDDMWHATVNGRGKMLNAKTAADLNTAVNQMMAEVSGKEGTQSGIAVSTASLTKDTKKYTPSYTPVSWSGNVTAYSLDPLNGNQMGIAWQVETLVSTDPITGANTYSSIIPSAGSRNIYVGNGATSGTRAALFTYAAMSSAGLTSSMTGTVTSGLIDYLRGDATNEDTSATSSSTTAIYRARTTRLGDIVNSTPVFVKDTADLSYEKLPSGTAGQSTYRAFVDGTGATPSGGKKQRAEGVLFVGANDGMLHAFRDGTSDPATGAIVNPGGVETFAYVPKALLPTLNQLADKAYVHRYFVDGPNIETDAYFSSGTPHWANIVLGTTGAGAGAASSSGVSPRTAVYAIDVTSLNTSTTTMNASNVLWEVSSSNASFTELGYVLTDVQAGPTLDGSWVAIFGNGYESASCKAQLFIVNLANGALIKKIDTLSGNCSTAKNGLGGVRVVRNASQQIIGAYAGDLLGNLWKFNLNNSSSGSWAVDLGGSALFTAGSSQPITATPAVVTLTSSSSPAGGYMVVAGTGKFYEVGDITTTTTQSLYGIWDPVAFGAATIPAGTALTSKTLLVQQTIGAAQTDASGNTYFAISTNAVNYTGATPKRGWYIDLPNTGQRVVYPLDLLAQRYVTADTISPANVSLDPCSQTTGGTGYLYFIDALTGAGPTVQILDTNGDGNIDSSDLLVSGIQGKADGRNVSLLVDSNASRTNYVNLSGGSPGGTLVSINCSLLGTCISIKPSSIKSRQWRQLFMR